jgi:hypothetical protein
MVMVVISVLARVQNGIHVERRSPRRVLSGGDFLSMRNGQLLLHSHDGVIEDLCRLMRRWGFPKV